MKTVLTWLNSALAKKDAGINMNYYRVKGGTISATNGDIVASHPWKFSKQSFLVPGKEFEKVLSRMDETPTLSLDDNVLTMKSGRFHGKVQILPPTEWNFPGVDGVTWKPIPKELMIIIAALNPFVRREEDKQVKVNEWTTCIALDNAWCYATNGVSIGGVECKSIGKIKALLPLWAIDFLLAHTEGIKEWAWADNYVAFRWASGAWMRSQLVVGQFSEKAAAMVRDSVKAKTTQKIDDKFREAFERVAELAEDRVSIYANRVESKFGMAVVEDGIKCEVPNGFKCSVFGARYLLPALKAADSWSPSVWPKPVPFKGKIVCGLVVGIKPKGTEEQNQ